MASQNVMWNRFWGTHSMFDQKRVSKTLFYILYIFMFGKNSYVIEKFCEAKKGLNRN